MPSKKQKRKEKLRKQRNIVTSNNPVSQNNPAPDTTNKAAEESETAAPPVLDIPALIQTDCKKSPHHGKTTYKQEKDWWDKTKPYVECAGAILLLIYTIYTVKMYTTNRDAADAATNAASTAHDALTKSTRPWVGPDTDIKLLKLPVVDKDGTMDLSYEVRLKNFGTSPALNVEINVAPYIESGKPEENFQKKFVDDKCRATTAQGNLVIFPGNETIYDTDGFLYNFKGNPWFTLEGCAVYGDQFQERVHHTRFCFVVPTHNQFPVHQCVTTAD